MYNIPTYQMEFKAKLQRIDTQSQTMVVYYTDPHGNEDVVMNINISLPLTEDNIKKIIVQHTPHQTFHFNNLKKIAVESGELDKLVGLTDTEFEYKIPTYDNS
jgi:hypothetical protein